MTNLDKYRIAWLLPSMGKGGISWQHILCEFTKKIPQTITFTGTWTGFAHGFENTFKIKKVGETKFVETGKKSSSYGSGFSYASPSIVNHLLCFQPQIIFANAFSIWTALALIFKPLGKWRVIINYEGSSPGVDYTDSKIRLLSRRLMVRLADAFVINNQLGKTYFINSLGAKEERIFTRPFLVPSLTALMAYSEDLEIKNYRQSVEPVFLYVGQIVPRKGVNVLLEACSLLKKQGYNNYTLLIVGDGVQRPELEKFTEESGLTEQVKWVGKVEYGRLGAYFKYADIFVFPTYEDIWGMVLPEAMVFGKPVVCSTGAGAAELVIDGGNGFVFDPKQSDKLAQYMRQFLDNPSLIEIMGKQSMQIMLDHTPEEATKCFIEAVKFVTSK
jgi:glycosyltransferase involved in cell wall biosynthesis